MPSDILVKSGFDQLAGHIGHSIELVGYGKGGKPPWVGLAIECNDCDCVISDWTHEDAPIRYTVTNKGRSTVAKKPRRKR